MVSTPVLDGLACQDPVASSSSNHTDRTCWRRTGEAMSPCMVCDQLKGRLSRFTSPRDTAHLLVFCTAIKHGKVAAIWRQHYAGDALQSS